MNFIGKSSTNTCSLLSALEHPFKWQINILNQAETQIFLKSLSNLYLWTDDCGLLIDWFIPISEMNETVQLKCDGISFQQLKWYRKDFRQEEKMHAKEETNIVGRENSLENSELE